MTLPQWVEAATWKSTRTKWPNLIHGSCKQCHLEMPCWQRWYYIIATSL